MKQLRDSAEKFAFQAEVNRMMKLIINSLYRNKEVGIQSNDSLVSFYAFVNRYSFENSSPMPLMHWTRSDFCH